MTLDRDSQLKSLVDDIAALLTTDVGSAEEDLTASQTTVSSRAKDVLGRAQSVLSELVSGPSEGSTRSVVQSVEQEIQKLREETLSPLKADLDGLRQQQKTLSSEVAQLEQQRQYYQSLAQQQSNQTQLVDDLVQPLRDRLESAVTEQVGKLLAEFKQGGDSSPGSDGTTEPLNDLQMNRVQEQSSEVLEQLQETLQTVFSALQANTQRYESTMQSSLERIQTLGEQSEAILEHWLGRLNSTGEVADGAGITQSDFVSNAAPDLSETDPAFAGVPYPGMDLPTSSAPSETEAGGTDELGARGLSLSTADGPTAMVGMGADFDDADNPFTLGDLELTDLSYQPPAIATPAAQDEPEASDIDFVALDGIESPDDEGELLGELPPEIAEEERGDDAGLPIGSDPEAELPLMGLDLDGGVETDEDDDEEATVIQYVNVDMLNRRREETFQMPDVLVNLSADEGPKLAEDLMPDAEMGESAWQEGDGEDDATQYLSEDLSSLESSEPEGVAEVSVDLAAVPMAEAGVIPSEDSDAWGSEPTVEFEEAGAEESPVVGADFAAIASEHDGDDGLFSTVPSATSPEEAVVEETSGLDANPAVWEQDLDESLSDVDITADVAGVEEVEEIGSERDEEIMQSVMDLGSPDQQVELEIAGDAGDGLEDLLEINSGDESAALTTPLESEAREDESLALTELDNIAENLEVEGVPSEVEIMEGLPSVDELMDDAPASRSLDDVGSEEDMFSGASDLDQLGLGGETADPFAELNEEEDVVQDLVTDGGNEETDPAPSDSAVDDVITAPASAVGFAVFGGEENGGLEDSDDLGLETEVTDGGAIAEESAGDGLELEGLDLSEEFHGLDGAIDGDDLELAITEESTTADGAGEVLLPTDVDLNDADLDLALDGEEAPADLGLDLIDTLPEPSAPEPETTDVGAVSDLNNLDLDPESVVLEGELGDLSSLALDENEPVGLSGAEETDAEDTAVGVTEEEDLDDLVLGDLDLELPDALPESADGDVTELLDEAVEAADALDLDGLGDDGDSSSSEMDSSGDDGLADFVLDESDSEEVMPAADTTGTTTATADGDDVPVDLELEAVLGGGESSDGLSDLDDLGLDGDGGDLGESASLEANADDAGLGLDLDLEGLGGGEDGEGELDLDLDGTSEETVGEDLELDLDGLDAEGAAGEGLELDLEGLGDGTGEGEALEFELGDLGDSSVTTPEVGSVDDGLGDLGLEMEDVAGGSLDLEGLEGVLSDDLALDAGSPEADEAGSETIASLDEALNLGDLEEETTAVSTETEDFSLEMLDSLTEFSEESSPMAEIDADLDAFLADALGPDADGVEKKKE